MELHSTSSFEEGEAFRFNGDDDDDDDGSNFDPDVAFSYIDEKIQNLLGHCQKDFEGGVSAENLGAKFGGYGSFLPSYQRSPPRPQTKTPERNYKVSRSPVNLHVEAPAKNFTAPSKTPSLGRPAIASCNTKSLHIKKFAPPDGAINRDSCLLPVQVAEKSPLKNETVNQNRRWQPKVRIKMGSENFVRNNVAAVYTDLGLDDSPSSSGGDNSDISGFVPSKYHETSNESPTNILQEMTSFPVVGGLLLSPLHDDLLCLTTKDILLGESGSVLKGNQENSVNLANPSDSKMTVSNALKEKKTGIVAKVQRPKKNANGTGAVNVSTVLSSEKFKTVTSEGKNSMSKKLKLTQPTNLMCGIGGSTIDTVRAEANKDGLKGSSSSFHLVKEKPVGFYGRCNIEREGANNTSGYNHFEMKAADQQNGLQLDIQNEREALNVGVSEPSKQQLRLIENKGIKFSCRVGKELIGKKAKLNKVQNKGMQAANVVEKSVSLGLNTLSEDTYCIDNGVQKPKSKRLRLKKQNNEEKLTDHNSGFTGDIKVRQIENMEKSLGMMAKNFNPAYSEKEYDTFFDKSMERSTCGGEVEKKSTFEVSLKEPNGALTDNGPISEMALPLAVPPVIQEDWVGCDSCGKWRLLPYGTKPDQLPEKWICSMLNWLPGMNHCEISEDVTTKTLLALYQCPAPEIPVNGSKAVDETTLNGTSMNGHLINNYHNQISRPISARENKNYERKEILSTDSSSGLVQISNSTKNHHRESGKSKSLKGPNQITELATGQNESKHNKKRTRDDVKQANMKEKRNADQYDVGGSKRVKTGNFGFELNHNSQIDGGINCAEFSTMGTGRSMQKSAGVGSLKNATYLSKDKIYASAKKEKDESRLSLGGESSYLNVSDKRDDSLKKRKIIDQRDDRNPVDATPLPKDVKPKIVGSEFRKNKNTSISMGEGNASSSNNEKGRVPRIILSVNRGHRVDGIDKTTSKKHSEGQRCKNMVTLRPPTSNRNCGTEYVKTATTSSSSKVSGLRISKSKLQEVRGSPVESVSSSPLRTFYPEQVAPERRENCKESEAANGDIHETGSNQGRCLDDEGIDKGKQDRPTRKENDFRFVHNESNENSILDYRERHVNRKLDSKNKPSVDIQSSQSAVGDVDTAGHHIMRSAEHDKGLNNKDGFRSDCDRSKGVHYQLKKLDPSNQNSRNALKEAEDLKAFADSLKNSGFDDERRAAYFQAALKFLLAATLLETSTAERDGDTSQIELYISTAKHCLMCAREYEAHQDIATAALLYKCMEVAYMRAVYCKHSTTTRDRDELQATLKMPPLGESPSSCVSDVDNLNNQSTTYKATLTKGSGSHATGHVITPHNRPNIIRLLDFTQHVNLAMEASTKARNAFTAATLVLSEKPNKEGIDLLKRVVDFSFHDVEGFIRLVHLAMEAISRSGYNGGKDHV